MTERRYSRRQVFCSAADAAGFSLALALLSRSALGQALTKEIKNLKPGEFTWHPERSPSGPLAIVVSIPDQRVHVYRNAIRIAVSTCSTGKPGHLTPTGVFTILQKDKNHHSSTYNDAPMPNMNRLTWNGIAIHAGNLPGYPASHGCVRLPLKFSELLFSITQVGTPVILAGSATDPKEVSHPGLVLTNYATSEFPTVKTGLKKEKLPWAAEVIDFSQPISILVSSADKTASIITAGQLDMQVPVEITGQNSPLGSHVFVLAGASASRQGMAWHAIGHHSDSGVAVGQPEESVLKRISFAQDMRGWLQDHLHVGMTIITTDLPAHPDTRTGTDFVVMSQETS